MDESEARSDEEVLRWLQSGRRPRRGPRRTRREPALTGMAALFLEYVNVSGDYFEQREARTYAKSWAVRWANAMKSDLDAKEFLRLGGRPTELKILVAWDDNRIPREALGRNIVSRRGEDLGTALEVLRMRAMPLSQIVAVYHRTGT